MNLTRKFAVVGGVVILVAMLALAYANRMAATAHLVAQAEQNNVALARTLANNLWQRFSPFLQLTIDAKLETARGNPYVAALHAEVVAQLRGLNVVKVKIYDPNGMTVFSTDPKQVGEDKRGNAGFRTARAGTVVSELTFSDTFSAFE
jgi:hypothetical protein